MGPPHCPVWPSISARPTLGTTFDPTTPPTVAPFRNWSVLHRFMRTKIHFGGVSPSTVTSLGPRWFLELNWPPASIISSPALKQPKKHRHIAAHSMLPSGSRPYVHARFRILRSSGVTGDLAGLVRPASACPLWMPLRTSCSFGIVSHLGSKSPSMICRCLMPARYSLIAATARFC